MPSPSKTTLYAALLSALTALAVLPSSAQACSCRLPTVEDHMTMSDAVFRGEVLEVWRGGPAGPGDDSRAQSARIAVDKTWKGDLGAEVILSTHALDGAMCGFVLEAGQEQVFFAQSAPKGALDSNLCLMAPYQGRQEDYKAVLPE